MTWPITHQRLPDGFDSRERASLAVAIDGYVRARAAIDAATGRLRAALAAVAEAEGNTGPSHRTALLTDA